jgi:hypothetical protein
MISREALLAVAVLGLLGSATKAHAGWYRVLGGTARTQETSEEFTRRASKYVKAKAPAKSFDERALKRVEADNNRRMMTSVSHKYTPLIGRSTAASTHILASKSFGTPNIPSIAERLGGSHGHILQATNSDRIFKHNANLFLKPTTVFSPWANQWRGGNNSGRRIFAFNN